MDSEEDPAAAESAVQNDMVMTKIGYVKWLKLYDEEKPFVLLYDVPAEEEDQRTANLIFEQVDKEVLDVRESASNFTLDENGFEFVKHETRVTSFQDRKTVDTQYLPETELLLRRELGDLDFVYFFDWRVRDSEIGDTFKAEDSGHGGDNVNVDLNGAASGGEGEFDLNDYTLPLGPASYCHIDQSPSAVLSRIQLQLSDKADDLLMGRVRLINIWRPLVNAVEDWPLAVCDATSTSIDDFLEADHVRRQYTGATLYGMNNSSHKWYYMSAQKPDEVLLMKVFDSDETVRATYCPHAAIKLPNVRPGAPSRKSIEVRALVFSKAES